MALGILLACVKSEFQQIPRNVSHVLIRPAYRCYRCELVCTRVVSKVANGQTRSKVYCVLHTKCYLAVHFQARLGFVQHASFGCLFL
jgi:hypothetical protein